MRSEAHGDESSGLQVHDLAVRFAGIQALADVSFDVAPGEIVGVIGPNGAGKTTLFNAICNFVPVAGGSIRWGGNELCGLAPEQIARMGVARTVQALGLWSALTPAENLAVAITGVQRAPTLRSALGWPGARRQVERHRHAAREALARFGVADVADVPCGELPYGIQKRICIARALVTRPRLLLLDEPASGLSESEFIELRSWIDELRGDCTVVVVEHHLDFVMPLSDRIVVLDFGRVLAIGTPAEIASNAEVVDAYLGEPVERTA